MLKRMNYLWRLFGTGLSFFLFGAVGLLLWGLLFPLFEPFFGSGPKKKRRVRFLMYRTFRLYMDFMRLIGILDYRELDGEKLNRADGCLVIANHPCLLDIVFLISRLRNATCIVKPALIANPFMRIPIRAMGYIYAEDPEQLLARCQAELQEGAALVVFPEGTRTTPGQPLKFQRGAAAIALQAGADIVPVTLACEPATLRKREKWYRIPEKKFTLSLYVGDHIQLTPISENGNRSLATRHLTRQLEHYFTEQLTRYGNSRSRA